MLKKLGRHPLLLKFMGLMMAYYLLLVRKTSSVEMDPPGFLDQHKNMTPFVVSMWHGQHFLTPFARPQDWEIRVMVSKSADGEINAVAAKRLGIGLIRASGAQKAHQISKRGGLRGFIEAMRALKEGASVAMTADVPKGPARVSGMGIIQLAKHSGRPILPMAIASSRHYDFNSWDKASLNLPFSHICMSFAEPINVPSNATESELEELRQQLENVMNDITARAYERAYNKRKALKA
ncbi:lysophospholipid acyltransferase family protein [Polycladidibacter stylochi]|uniref:lysophospholipid acyltransferase family protein n=1 Tax=Polycladidibacter stylochi TaxID=1807766 RepID=UPI00082C880A|nr:lysophospholipid acyltransferase family protein [Pseudovibrio stylochi]